VLGEVAQTPRHRVGGHEPAAQERQDHQQDGGVARGLHAVRGQPHADGQPGHRKRHETEEDQRDQPVPRPRVGPVAQQQRERERERHGEQGFDHGAEHVPGEHGDLCDVHGPNRAMIPPVMSRATSTAVPSATLATAMTRMPGVMNTR
jgi:hypothetical protein